MKGGLDFREALKARLGLLKTNLETIKNFTRLHPPKLTKDIE